MTFNNQPDVSGAPLGASDATERRISLRISSSGYISYYHSREAEDASKRPQLEVAYTP
ncbi:MULTISPECIES: hypothetical protein [Myxococcus]|nr:MULTISPECIES: hypothetical protein [Myxococcus]